MESVHIQKIHEEYDNIVLLYTFYCKQKALDKVIVFVTRMSKLYRVITGLLCLNYRFSQEYFVSCNRVRHGGTFAFSYAHIIMTNYVLVNVSVSNPVELQHNS